MAAVPNPFDEETTLEHKVLESKDLGVHDKLLLIRMIEEYRRNNKCISLNEKEKDDDN